MSWGQRVRMMRPNSPTTRGRNYQNDQILTVREEARLPWFGCRNLLAVVENEGLFDNAKPRKGFLQCHRDHLAPNEWTSAARLP